MTDPVTEPGDQRPPPDAGADPLRHVLERAGSSLDAGDPAAAVDDVVAAVGIEPDHPAVLELLDRVAATAGPTAADLVPERSEWNAEGAATRAWLLLATGHVDQGMSLLLDVVSSDVNRPWGTWLEIWTERLGAELTVSGAALVRACRRLVATVERAPGGSTASSADLACGQVTALVAHFLPMGPPDTRLLTMGSAVARRAGRADLAARWAFDAERLEPVYWTSTMAAYALREAGRTDEAVAAFKRAVAHDPDNLEVRIDAAATLANEDRLTEAIVWLEAVLSVQPDHPLAAPMAAGLRTRMASEAVAAEDPAVDADQ